MCLNFPSEHNLGQLRSGVQNYLLSDGDHSCFYWMESNLVCYIPVVNQHFITGYQVSNEVGKVCVEQFMKHMTWWQSLLSIMSPQVRGPFCRYHVHAWAFVVEDENATLRISNLCGNSCDFHMEVLLDECLDPGTCWIIKQMETMLRKLLSKS